MHETSLARQIVDLAVTHANAAGPGAHTVRVVRGWVAETESLSPDSLRFHFAAHARGTPAEHATLDLRVIHVDARCRTCGQIYAPEHHVLICPACGSTDGDVLGETGLKIETVEID